MAIQRKPAAKTKKATPKKATPKTKKETTSAKDLVDLAYDPASLLPPAKPAELKRLEKEMSHYLELEDLRLPPAFVQIALRYHGGAPAIARFVAGKRKFAIGRFLNLLRPRQKLPGAERSWRSWGDSKDVRRDFSIDQYRNLENWAMKLYVEDHPLLPIAALSPCGGMEEYDLLCLDYADGVETPSVVVLKHDAWDVDGDQNLVIPVANTFDDFLKLLHQSAPKIGRQRPENEW